MGEERFTWIPFYEELASKLLGFKNNRQELLEKMKRVFADAGFNFPKMEKNSDAIDIDPFTFYAHFNKGNNRQRMPLVTGIAKEFGIKASIPSDFNGIPTVNAQSANFFRFKDQRGERDIDNLWDLFDSALRLAENDNEENRQPFCKYYNSAIEMKGIAYNITMGLYWVRPYIFLNLDKRSRWFLRDVGNMPEELVEILRGLKQETPSASNYLQIINKVKTVLGTNKYPYRNLPELSYHAWKVSEDVNQRKKGIELPVETTSRHYWLLAPGKNAENWSDFYNQKIMCIGWDELGDLKSFAAKEQIRNKMNDLYGKDSSHKNDVLAVWQFANEVKAGDVIFVKKGREKIIGRGEVISNYEFNSKAEVGFKHIHKVNWTHNEEKDFHQTLSMKTLTDITKLTETVEDLESLFNIEPRVMDQVTTESTPYDRSDFLKHVFMSEDDYNHLCELLETKKNIILQGAPGVGKTYAAAKFAYSWIGEKNQDQVMVTQFHQSYSYEDFIMGIRPRLQENGFEIKDGVFYSFCKKARDDEENDYFFIIDEINRGNLSKILGELFMLLEADKRGQELQLMYKNEKFSIPQNVYIIGTMNTADRSIAMVDYALRRRFAFFTMTPGFDTEGFRKKQETLDDDKFDALINCVKKLNAKIAEDESLGEGFAIGHSYFCGCFDGEEYNLSNIVEYELIPLLKEYWFDNPEEVKKWSNNLRQAIA